MKKDELVNELLAEANRQSNETSDLLNRAAEIIAEHAYRAGWNDCRAEMLAAAPSSPEGDGGGV